jgi:hypothetical protein
MWISFCLDAHSVTTKHLYLTSSFCFRHVFMFPNNSNKVIQGDTFQTQTLACDQFLEMFATHRTECDWTPQNM